MLHCYVVLGTLLVLSMLFWTLGVLRNFICMRTWRTALYSVNVLFILQMEDQLQTKMLGFCIIKQAPFRVDPSLVFRVLYLTSTRVLVEITGILQTCYFSGIKQISKPTTFVNDWNLMKNSRLYVIQVGPPRPHLGCWLCNNIPVLFSSLSITPDAKP